MQKLCHKNIHGGCPGGPVAASEHLGYTVFVGVRRTIYSRGDAEIALQKTYTGAARGDLWQHQNIWDIWYLWV